MSATKNFTELAEKLAEGVVVNESNTQSFESQCADKALDLVHLHTDLPLDERRELADLIWAILLEQK